MLTTVGQGRVYSLGFVSVRSFCSQDKSKVSFFKYDYEYFFCVIHLCLDGHVIVTHHPPQKSSDTPHPIAQGKQ